jgi:hypothetical protein
VIFTSVTDAGADPVVRRSRYAADVGILYDMLTFHVEGSIEESVDRGGGEYKVLITGSGTSIANRLESGGILREGRWTPLRSQSWFDVRGRQSRTEVDYDHGRRRIEYHARSETFFLRRRRVVDDVVTIPDGIHVDDVISATLNYAEGHWLPRGGELRTYVIRRRQAANEGPDDVASSYRAELVPLQAKLTPEPATGKAYALFDLSPFSSWIRPSQPARIVFGANRRPELITTSMILGSSVTIRFGEA